MKLTTPDPVALQRSTQLTQLIRAHILESAGGISFADFMHYALYTPELGYYSGCATKLGHNGDFITAPEITPLFARCIAKQCHAILQQLTQGSILELGAGSGRFAKDLLLELERLGLLPEHYFIVEISPNLRQRQRQLLATTCPHLLTRVQWLDTYPQDFVGIIFANEVVDALPVQCFRVEKDGIKERFVQWQNEQFTWHSAPASPELSVAVQHLVDQYHLPHGYESEINLALPQWINTIATTLKQGILLIFDYGYGRNEYYHPDRQQGTLMCYYQHHAHTDPFQWPGLQDMTAHVDFTTVAKAATTAGLSLAGFTTQAGFLLSNGILEIIQNNQLDTIDQIQQTQAIKKLTLPSQMGEAVKVLGLSKNLDIPLQGFSLFSRINML